MPDFIQMGDIADGYLLSSPLPCLLIDEDGIVFDASPAAKRLCASVANRPLSEAFGISREALAEHLASQGRRLLVGESIDANEHTKHVLAQAVEVPERSATLIVLTDLQPSRDAEELRFNVTPYPVLRLSFEGRILFANEAAQRTLGANLIERRLRDIFPAAAQGELVRGFATDPRESSQFDLPAPDALQSSEGISEVRLFLMPDLGPGGFMIGRIAVISWDIYKKYRDALSDAVEHGKKWDVAFRNMLDVLRNVVPHDRAIFGIFSEDGTRFRAMLVHPPFEPPWPRRWVNVPRDRAAKVAKGSYVDNNWNETIKAYPALLQDPTVQRNIEDNVIGTLVLPIGGQGIPDGVLTLTSRSKAAFDGQALPLLSALRIESYVATLLRTAEREGRAAIGKIGDDVVKAQSVGEAADLLLKGLVTHFQWDHAAIFFADIAEHRTLLARQYPHLNESGKLDDLAVEAGYSQPLDPDRLEESGMLGAAFFAEKALVVEDTEILGANGKPQYNYRTPPGARPRRSAMTIPVRTNGQIRLLLDIESLTTHAFSDDDKRLVERIVRNLENRMLLLNERVLSKALLDIIEQGTIMTDRAGRILRANRKAEDLLRLTGLIGGWGRISEYGADKPSREVLASHAIVERQPIRVCSHEGGVGNAVLASRRDLDSDTGDSVWLFTDLRIEEWQHDSHFIESTIREVADQARGPLMLAVSFVKRIADGALSIDLASRAVTELGKASLTYKRIADSVEARKEPIRTRRLLQLGLLLPDLMKALPKWDVDQIELLLPRGPLPILGDGARIELAVRLILAFFLARLHRIASEDKTIDLQLRRRKKMAVIGLSLRQHKKSGARLQKLQTRRGAPLETASIIIAAHGGEIAASSLDSTSIRMEIRLPLSEAPDAN